MGAAACFYPIKCYLRLQYTDFCKGWVWDRYFIGHFLRSVEVSMIVPLLALFTALFTVLCSMANAADAAYNHWLPNVRLVKHGSVAVGEYLRGLKEAPFNHEYAGYSRDSDDTPTSSFRVLHRRVKIGTGKSDFAKASRFLHSFEMINNLGWAEVIGPRGDDWDSIRPGDVIGTLVNCYRVVWSLNPCRVTSVRKEGNVSEVGFSTLSGHLIAGEERFRVTLDPVDSSVVFSMFSFTKGASSGPGILGVGRGVVGKVAMPFIRPLQRDFFRSQEKSMLTIMTRKE